MTQIRPIRGPISLQIVTNRYHFGIRTPKITQFGPISDPILEGLESLFRGSRTNTDAAGRLGQIRPVQALDTTPRGRGGRDENRLQYNILDPHIWTPKMVHFRV